MHRIAIDVGGTFTDLVVSHATNDFLEPQEVAEITAGRYGPFFARSEAEFAWFFEGVYQSIKKEGLYAL